MLACCITIGGNFKGRVRCELSHQDDRVLEPNVVRCDRIADPQFTAQNQPKKCQKDVYGVPNRTSAIRVAAFPSQSSGQTPCL